MKAAILLPAEEQAETIEFAKFSKSLTRQEQYKLRAFMQGVMFAKGEDNCDEQLSEKAEPVIKTENKGTFQQMSLF